MAFGLMDVFVKVGADTSDLESGIDKAKGLASGLGGVIGTGMKMAGAAIAGATAAVGGFTASAIKVSSGFDSAMSQVSATLGLTTEDIKNNVNGAGDAYNALREKAEEAGRSTIFSASESAEGLNILAMSGYTAEESISMLDDVLHLAAAGSMDMATAAGYVSGAMKGFNDDTKDSAYYADLMAKGATLANTSVSQLGDAMSSGAAGAAAYGQSADSMTVSLLRLAEQGEVGAAAGTALAAAMKNIYSPTDQAKKILTKLGVDAFDKTTGKARDFNTVVNELDSALSGYTDEQKAAYKQTIFGIQGLDAFNKMTVTGAEKQEAWADALADSTGEAAKQYGTMTENLEGDIDGWNSALEGFQVAITQGVMPSLRRFVQFGTNGLSQITDAFKADGLSGAMKAFKKIFSDGLKQVTTVLPEAVNIGVELLGVLGQGIIDNAPIIFNAIMQIGSILGEKLLGFMETLADVTADFDWSAAVQTLIDNIVNFFTSDGVQKFIKLGGEIVINVGKGLISTLPTLVSNAQELMGNLGEGLKSGIPNILPIAMNAIMDFSGSLRENAGKLVNSGLGMILNIADGLIQALPSLIKTIPTIIINICGIINDNAPKLLAAGVMLIGKLLAGIVQSAPTIIAEFPKIVQAIFAVITAVNWINLGAKIITGIVNGVKGLSSSLPNTMRNIGNKAVEFVKNIDWKNLGSNIINFIKNGITSLTNTIPNALKEIALKAIDFVKEIDWVDLGKNIVDGIAAGIVKFASSIGNALVNAVRGSKKEAEGDLGIESPSKVFRNDVGKYMGLGVAAGIEDSIPDVQGAMADLTDAAKPDSINMGGTDIFGSTSLDSDVSIEKLANAIVDAFVRADIGIELDNREFGRLIRKAVAY